MHDIKLQLLYNSYLANAKNILATYNGNEPFSAFLKKHFSTRKKFGSRDRKCIANICYAYFRFGKAAPEINNNTLLQALFLTEPVYNSIVNTYKPEWKESIIKTIQQKAACIKFDYKRIFPFKEELSDKINFSKFCASFLIQPKLFLRLRPHKKNSVVRKLQVAKIPFALIEEDCIALTNGTKLDEIIDADKDAVIQDYNSQQVLNYLKNISTDKKNPITIWDCCAASGGKSILAYDILKKNIQLTVSDIRLSILLNLHQRFNRAGLNKEYNYFVGDLSTTDFKFPVADNSEGANNNFTAHFNIIICDVPCSGSGTWSRTPENLFYFNPESINEFAQKQKQIVTTAIRYLQNKGLFIYITCSVFKKENEEVVSFITKNFNLKLLQINLLNGYDKNSDSMFVAVFLKEENG